MTGAEALRAALPRLQAAGVEGAARDLRLLLAFATGIPPDRLTPVLADPLPGAAAARFEAAVTARVARQPVSQIVGGRLFWGRWFRVTPDVLDPRPETETLIAAALDGEFSRVLDLGTGSGAILITLLAERGEATGTGVDLSPKALSVAAANAAALSVAGRATFLQSDWLSAVRGRFDLVVANPPYIAQADMPGLSPEVRLWEPRLALTPGGDGLGACRSILRDVRSVLVPGGRVLLEIGASQGDAVAALCQSAGLQAVTVLQDMDGRDRAVSAVVA
ncbi:MAG: peptide chain release factor N(5)-glutamine methyltransferase [Rhodobacter sp.]|nr:peptide chain release factor N(5)-glutamine methyltransferase [Rhodobacter sp.]MCA3477440.1 peptide chain release factor N(5)-glutamine methyltransferase [Rhodobacter sp.]MCA4926633.1 peptide chain release factor N(5)-glutamine methyltransferase [Rhodobacter sp.]